MIRDRLKALLGPLFFRLHGRETGRRMEIRFWRRWIAAAGMSWPEDFARRIDPATPLHWPHAAIVGLLAGEEVRILDVGSGPITSIGFAAPPGRRIAITACDPNADDYNRLLAERGVVPPVRTQRAEGEGIAETFRGPFAYVTCSNALDHMRDPHRCLAGMLRLVGDDGAIYLTHEEDEGLREGYRGYHKWNLRRLGDGAFRVWNPDTSRDYDAGALGRPVLVRTVGGMVRILITRNPAVLDWAGRELAWAG